MSTIALAYILSAICILFIHIVGVGLTFSIIFNTPTKVKHAFFICIFGWLYLIVWCIVTGIKYLIENWNKEIE